MPWRQDSSAGAYIYDTEPMSAEDIACRDEELVWLKRYAHKGWKLINGRIAKSGDPVALQGLYGGLMALPPANSAPSVGVAATTTPGVGIWSTSTYTPLPSNGLLAPCALLCFAAGTIQTSTTSMTTTMLTGISAATGGSAPSVTTKTFGASGAATLATTALTGLFQMDHQLILQTGGTTGTAVSVGKMHYTTAAAPATSAQVNQILVGGTQATSIDFTGVTANLPGGFFVAAWASVATVTFVPQIIIFAAMD